MPSWLLLTYAVPREPSASRVYVWRKLKKLGALAMHDALWVLPATSVTQEHFRWLAAEIIEMKGDATVWEAASLLKGQDAKFLQQFKDTSNAAYRSILSDLKARNPDLPALARRFQQAKSRSTISTTNSAGRSVPHCCARKRSKPLMKWVTWQNIGVDRLGVRMAHPLLHRPWASVPVHTARQHRTTPKCRRLDLPVSDFRTTRDTATFHTLLRHQPNWLTPF